MLITKAKMKKIAGYLASILCLVFLGEPFLQETGKVIEITRNTDILTPAE